MRGPLGTRIRIRQDDQTSPLSTLVAAALDQDKMAPYFKPIVTL